MIGVLTVDKLINQEVELYVNYCRAASKHDEWEKHYRMAAHVIFYHIQEMRTTGQSTLLGFRVQPIS